ncbi:MAG: hypothetical protein HQK52_23330 [Oligoflexia bacterium]|nr:hypothetical protein [Oligoflexia bacterium]
MKLIYQHFLKLSLTVILLMLVACSGLSDISDEQSKNSNVNPGLDLDNTKLSQSNKKGIEIIDPDLIAETQNKKGNEIQKELVLNITTLHVGNDILSTNSSCQKYLMIKLLKLTQTSSHKSEEMIFEGPIDIEFLPVKLKIHLSTVNSNLKLQGITYELSGRLQCKESNKKNSSLSNLDQRYLRGHVHFDINKNDQDQVKEVNLILR